MSKKESILIIDDEKNIGNLLSKRFSFLGYKTFTATTSDGGYKIASQKKPSIVLLDISMPKTNGFEICQKLRSKEKTKDLPIIFLSGRATQQDKIKGLQMGGDDYLTKPFDMAELEARVERLLHRAKK